MVPVSGIWLPLLPIFMKLVIAERRYVAIVYTQLHPDWSRNVATTVEIRVGLYIKYGCPCADFHNSRLRTWFKEFFYRISWTSDRLGSRRYHDTDSHIGRRTDVVFP